MIFFCRHSGLSGIVFELKRLKSTTIPDKPEWRLKTEVLSITMIP
jgi:hypothetical protein